MSDKTLVLVTGGNQGLGFYAIQQMSATGKHHILMGSRDLSKAEQAIKTLKENTEVKANPDNVEPIQIDMSSDQSIEKAAKTVEQKYGRLDILMLNAGIAYTEGSVREQYQKIYDTNIFGASVTVEAFLPLLRKSTVAGGKRISFTSSGLASIKWAAESDGNYNGAMYGIYRSSKSAMNMVMVSYARQLEGEGFVVTATDPGYCATNLNAYSGFKDPREGAKALIRGAIGDKKDVHAAMVDEEQKQPW
ncbi:uncharacterized protein LTR77_000286 [Saxophila tyrrhenica]|uniref:NAD(P)-binding protein n=1 Tax=Saxophila tyrrhenica TaxID=1690608 RepID=A0AAV9PQ32_9PEZI|nr:hypothetical protein LTR77_000286 [Saxophila tyrrhenica]